MTREEQREFDRENMELNYLRPGLFKDTTVVPETEPDVPDDYREGKPVRIAKSIGLVALASYAAAGLAQTVSHGVSNVIVYVILAAWVALLGSLARK